MLSPQKHSGSQEAHMRTSNSAVESGLSISTLVRWSVSESTFSHFPVKPTNSGEDSDKTCGTGTPIGAFFSVSGGLEQAVSDQSERDEPIPGMRTSPIPWIRLGNIWLFGKAGLDPGPGDAFDGGSVGTTVCAEKNSMRP